jgi:hypothetical protein
MIEVMDYKYFGLLASLILLSGLLFIIWRWPQGKHLTFSQHVATQRHTILYYVLLFSIVLPLLLLFFINWFVPTLKLPILFTIFIVISSITQYVCTLIPEVGGWKTKYHRMLAGVSALFLLPPLGLLIISDSVLISGKCLALAGVLTMLSIVYVLMRGKGEHRYFLLLQSGYFAAFFVPVLLISYL